MLYSYKTKCIQVSFPANKMELQYELRFSRMERMRGVDVEAESVFGGREVRV